MITAKDTEILRELAKKYAQEAAKDVNAERRERAANINECIEQRPIVWIDELPWHELNVNNELTLQCTDETAREMEDFFRKALFKWKYFQADQVLEPVYAVTKSYTNTWYGVDIVEDIAKTDDGNNIVSHGYIDVLKDFDDLNKLKAPTITLNKDIDEKKMNIAEDVLHDILPVRLRGIEYIYHAPWDIIPRLRGADNVLLDCALRPDFMHALIKKFTEITTAEIDRYEELGLLDGYCTSLHHTPGYNKTLPGDAFSGGGGGAKNSWFRHMAQIFSSVSPAMYNELDIEYTKDLMSRFGLVYYGCCEPLDNIIPYLRQIPNMRKIGVSPWANVEKCAEQIGRDFVVARKPNPAAVSMTVDKEVVKKEIQETVSICRKHHCAFDYVLKDISSCGHKLQNLVDWNDTVMSTLDEMYS